MDSNGLHSGTLRKINDAAAPAPANQDRLARLTATAQREHLAVGCALGNALVHAMTAGDALLAMRELVPPGKWQEHLHQFTDISERSARVYVQVAKARPALERQSFAGPLSIAAALEYLRDPKASKRRPSAAKSETAKPEIARSSFDVLGWWGDAPLEERRHFLDGVGLRGLLAALPSEWQPILQARICGHLSATQLIDLLERRLDRDGVDAAVPLRKIRQLIERSPKVIDLKALPAAGEA